MINNLASVFPILRTRRIVLSRRELKIEALISTQENNSESSWLGSSDFIKYAKFYFLFVPDSMIDLVQKLQNPATRLLAFSSINFGLTPDAHWESNFPPEMLVEVSLPEVLQDNYNTTTPVSDLFSGAQNDIYFEASIPTSTINFEGSEKWHLVGFSHIDLKEITQDYGLSPSTFAGIGGNMTYDLVLRKTESQKLEAPTSIPGFFIETGQPGSQSYKLEPYYGPIHYHGDQNPGPEGYIGWMAGHPDGEMGPRLTTMETQYDKIVAKNFLNTEGLSSGYDDSVILDLYDLQDNVNNHEPFGEGLISNARSIVHYLNSLESSREVQDKIRNLSLAALQRDRINIFDHNQFSFITISEDESLPGGVSEESHHGAVFFVDHYKMITHNSNLGWMMDMHKNNPSEYSRSIVARFFNKSEIKNMNISRRRLTNDTVGNTRLTSNDFEYYDNNETPKRLVSTTELENRGLVLTKANEDAYIRELFPDGMERNRYRAFHLKDYDLFNNVSHGNYTYIFDFFIQDGIKKEFSNMLNSFTKRFSRFREYVVFSETPINRYTDPVAAAVGQNEEPEEGLSTYENVRRVDSDGNLVGPAIDIGCYNYKTNSFTTFFREEGYSRYYSLITNVVNDFAALYSLLNYRMMDEELSDLTETLRRDLDPRNNSCTPESIQTFVQISNDLISTCYRLITYDGIEEFNRIEQQKLVCSLESSREFPLIRVHADSRLKATAVRNTDVFWEPEGSIATIPQIRIPNTTRVLTDNFPGNLPVFPSRFFTLASEDTQGRVQGFTTLVERESFLELPRQKKLALTSMIFNPLDLLNRAPPTPGIPGSLATHQGRPTLSGMIKYDSLARMGTFRNSLGTVTFSADISRVFNAVQNVENRNITTEEERYNLLTKEMELVLCESVLKAETREEYIDTIINIYEDIAFIKDELGILYDDLKYVSMFVESGEVGRISELATARNNSNSDLPGDPPTPGAHVELENYLFESKVLVANSIIPGKQPTPFNESPTKIEANRLVKYDPIVNTGNSGILVNNVIIGE